MNEMADGRYDVFIIDAEIIDATTMRVELMMVNGEDKGNVFALRGPLLAPDPIELLGLPATMTVVDGMPTVHVDRA
jgi:hypothetical protein